MKKQTIGLARVFLIINWFACYPSAFSQDSEIEKAQALFDEIFGEVFSRDEEKLLDARELWEGLAAKGDPGSKYFLSFLYRSGLGGVERDEARSMSLVKAAAVAGYASAQASLGIWYETGENVDQDWDVAVDWYRRAAANGSSFARARLYRAFSNGEMGLPKDAEQAQLYR